MWRRPEPEWPANSVFHLLSSRAEQSDTAKSNNPAKHQRDMLRIRLVGRSTLKIVIFGAGVQGTVFAVRLALAGHHVTLVARPARATELRQRGAAIQDAGTSRICTRVLPVLEKLPPEFPADICLVTVRREQIDAVLPVLVEAIAIPRVVFLGNHAYHSDNLISVLGRSRTVLAFPGIAGYCDGAIVRYLDIPQQHTVVEQCAQDVASLFRGAGFRVDRVRDMEAWLQRHAVFITAMAGALYGNDCDARLLARNAEAVCRLIVGVRGGWAAQDRHGIGGAPLALRTILCRVPLRLSAIYWSRLLASPRGDLYFARHALHAPAEMHSLADAVRSALCENEAPKLKSLLASIDGWQGNSRSTCVSTTLPRAP
jgi:2-dehydropantoate 2-reductase